MASAFYDSPLHHPLAAWLAGVVVLLVAARRRHRLGRARLALCLLLEAEIVVDALFTGGWSPLAAGSRAATVAAVLFVVLGDWRYFFLLARQGAGRPLALGRSLVLALFLPVTSALAARRAGWSDRLLYFVYEAGFVVLALVLRARLVRHDAAALPPAPDDAARAAAAELRRWLVLVTGFEIAQYGLWALADLLLLVGAPGALGLRIVPNLLYYCGFVPFAVFTAPDTMKA